jgi:hypothetical protein
MRRLSSIRTISDLVRCFVLSKPLADLGARLDNLANAKKAMEYKAHKAA